MTLASTHPVDRPLVRITATSHVDVLAEERDDVDVRGDARVVRTASTTTISTGSGRLSVKVPVGTDLVIGTTSGRVSVSGSVGAVSVVTETGKVAIERAQATDVRSDTGRIDIGHSDGHCRVRSGKGSVSIDSCARADVATASGRIALRDVRGAVHAHCTTGRIDIEMAGPNDVDAETISGRIVVSLPLDVRVFRTEVAPGLAKPDDADCTVFVRSVTGRVDVGTR